MYNIANGGEIKSIGEFVYTAYYDLCAKIFAQMFIQGNMLQYQLLCLYEILI